MGGSCGFWLVSPLKSQCAPFGHLTALPSVRLTFNKTHLPTSMACGIFTVSLQTVQRSSWHPISTHSHQSPYKLPPNRPLCQLCALMPKPKQQSTVSIVQGFSVPSQLHSVTPSPQTSPCCNPAFCLPSPRQMIECAPR